jgi:hypothetical protein
VALRDAGADLPHDLLDVDPVARGLAATLVRGRGMRLRNAAIGAAPIGTAPAAVEVRAPPMLWIVISHS